jgi:pyruvoyl-dependent arginine decarboxylase (PvlArgDC)
MKRSKMRQPRWKVHNALLRGIGGKPVSGAFASSPAKVGDLLTTNSLPNDRIVIPQFQRGYMWKSKHVEAFWQDVDKQRIQGRTKGADPHFFGPIVTLSKPTEEVIWLLDGQQRVATATILLSVLRDVAREITKQTGTQAGADFAAKLQLQFIYDEDGGYSVEMGETDSLYFKNTIQSDPPLKTKATNLTHRNIKAARALLWEKVVVVTGTIQPQMDAIQAVASLKELKQTIVADLVMARIPVTSQEAAFKIFTTLNDRGLRLSPPDLLLSYLMETAEEADRKDIRATWTQMINKMGTHDIHDFLRAMWVSRHGDVKKDTLFTAVKEYIEKNHVGSKDFATECGDECDDYLPLALADETQLPKESFRFVRALTRELGFKPVLPLLLSSYILLQPGDFEKVAQYLLVFVVRYSIIGNLDPGGMENLLFRLAREVRTMVKDENDKAASKQATDAVRVALSANAPDDSAIKSAVVKDTTTLEPSDAKYVMKRLANYIQDKEKQIAVADTNLEHIYPQNPDENEWGGKANQEKLEPYTWHIGNLTIFGKKANAKVENKEYPIKQPKYAASPVRMTSGLAAHYSNWDEGAILHRATYLAQLIVEVWNFGNPTYV